MNTDNLRIANIKLRPWIFRFLYPYKVVLVDIETNTYYSDVMDENGICKNFKPLCQIKYNSE